MAVATTTIDGKVLDVDGSSAGPGSIRIAPLPQGGTVDDGGTTQVVGAVGLVAIATDGSVGFQLIPTNLITSPGGGATIYRFDFETTSAKWTAYYELLDSAGDPVNIGALDRVGAPEQAIGWRLRHFTLATRPALTLNNSSRPYVIDDPPFPSWVEIIESDGSGGFGWVNLGGL